MKKKKKSKGFSPVKFFEKFWKLQIGEGFWRNGRWWVEQLRPDIRPSELQFQALCGGLIKLLKGFQDMCLCVSTDPEGYIHTYQIYILFIYSLLLLSELPLIFEFKLFFLISNNFYLFIKWIFSPLVRFILKVT